MPVHLNKGNIGDEKLADQKGANCLKTDRLCSLIMNSGSSFHSLKATGNKSSLKVILQPLKQ